MAFKRSREKTACLPVLRKLVDFLLKEFFNNLLKTSEEGMQDN